MTAISHGHKYLTISDQHWACDIEADNLLDKATKIWCVCLINVVTKKRQTFTNAGDFQTWLGENSTSVLVGHNFIAYDLVMLNRFWKMSIPVTRVVDTYVLSQLYNPKMGTPPGCKKGGHSLEAWGLRLKFPKTEHTDFTVYSTTMAQYCMNDTILTAYLFRKLTERMNNVGFSEIGCEIEHLAWNIIQNKQKKNGFPFDVQRAELLHVSLRRRCEELREEIEKLWPPRFQEVARYKAARKKDGTRSANYVRHLGQYPELRDLEDGGYVAYDWVRFNLGSPSERIEKLLELGWQPVSFTPKTDKGGGGNPKVDEDSLLEFAETHDRPEAKALAKWVVCNSRANMLFNTKKNGEEGGWINEYNPDTKAIHGSLFIAGTLRYRHSGPNSANIPAVRLKKVDGKDVIQYGEAGGYSYEARDLWTCGDPREWSLVGLDGTGIQARVLANYAYSDSFTELVLSGDIHAHNIKVLGLTNKAAAKKFFYTFIMGGGGARLAADQLQFGTKLTPREGEKLKKDYIASVPGFYELIERLTDELDRTGRITLCDGTPILVPSPHMVIPYLLQGDESRLMKKALVLVDEMIRRKRWTEHVLKVADIHDEIQYRVRVGYEEAFVQEALPCFEKAGVFFNYRLPIQGDAKIGKTWAKTH